QRAKTDHTSVVNSRSPGSVDGTDMDSKLIKQITRASMEPNDLVAFLFEFEGYPSRKPKGTMCHGLITLEREHNNGAAWIDFIVGAMYFRDVLSGIAKLKRQ